MAIKPVKFKNKNRNKKTGSKNQTRKFFLLFIAFWLLFYGLWVLSSQKKKTIPVDQIPKDTVNQVTPVFFPESDTLRQHFSKSSEDQLKYFCLKLGVLEKLIKIKEKNNEKNVFLPLNVSKMELNFANYFFTKNLTANGWRFINGIENTSGNTQTLSFYSPGNIMYIINLYYDKSKSYPVEKPKVSIFITELGENYQKSYNDIFKIVHPINYAVLPDRKYTKKYIELITKAGYELIINIPMEPIDYPMTNPGKNSIFVKMNQHEINNMMDSFIKDFPNAKGALNYLGSLVTTDEEISKIFLKKLKEKNLYFVDNLTPTSSLAYNCAQKMVLSSYKRSMYLKLKDSKSVDLMVSDVKNSYSQIVILVTPLSEIKDIKLLKSFCDKLTKEGFQIVFGSELEEEI